MNDFQNAYVLSEQAQQEANHIERIKAEALHAAGYSVVMGEGPAHCGYTDAILRTPSLSLVGTYSEREYAENALARLERDRQAYADEATYYIWPKPEPQPAPPEPERDPDIPF